MIPKKEDPELKKPKLLKNLEPSCFWKSTSYKSFLSLFIFRKYLYK